MNTTKLIESLSIKVSEAYRGVKKYSGSVALAAFVALLGTAVLLGVFVGLLGLFGWVFAAVWNYAVPTVWAAAPVLTAWKAAGLLFVGNTLGNFVGRRHVEVTVKAEKKAAS